MELRSNSIQAFIQAYREEYGEELPESEAKAMLQRLVALYRLVARPLPSEGNDSSPADQEDWVSGEVLGG